MLEGLHKEEYSWHTCDIVFSIEAFSCQLSALTAEITHRTQATRKHIRCLKPRDGILSIGVLRSFMNLYKASKKACSSLDKSSPRILVLCLFFTSCKHKYLSVLCARHIEKKSLAYWPSGKAGEGCVKKKEQQRDTKAKTEELSDQKINLS